MVSAALKNTYIKDGKVMDGEPYEYDSNDNKIQMFDNTAFDELMENLEAMYEETTCCITARRTKTLRRRGTIETSSRSSNQTGIDTGENEQGNGLEGSAQGNGSQRQRRASQQGGTVGASRKPRQPPSDIRRSEWPSHYLMR